MKPSAHNKEGPELQRLPVLGWNFVIYIVLCKKTKKQKTKKTVMMNTDLLRNQSKNP